MRRQIRQIHKMQNKEKKEKKEKKMKTPKILSKLINAKTGAIAGTIAGLNITHPDWPDIIARIVSGQVHGLAFEDLASAGAYAAPGIIMAIGAGLIKPFAAKLNPILGKACSFASAAGGAYAAGVAIHNILYRLTHSGGNPPGPPGPSWQGDLHNAHFYPKVPQYAQRFSRSPGGYTMETRTPSGTPNLAVRQTIGYPHPGR